MTGNDPHTVVDISSDHTAGTQDRREIQRMHYRGWFVDVDGGTIILPQQRWRRGMVPEDMMVCLQAAATQARANHPKPRSSSRPDPAPPLLREANVAKTLRLLRSIATDHWHPFNCDIYECISQAWEQAGMNVAHADVVRAVRAALPGRDERLIEFNDTRRREHLLALLDRAIHQAELAAEHIPGSTHAKTASNGLADRAQAC